MFAWLRRLVGGNPIDPELTRIRSAELQLRERELTARKKLL